MLSFSKICSAVFVQTKGLGTSFADIDVVPDRGFQLTRTAVRSALDLLVGEVCNHRSTRLIPDELVGVKCR